MSISNNTVYMVGKDNKLYSDFHKAEGYIVGHIVKNGLMNEGNGSGAFKLIIKQVDSNITKKITYWYSFNKVDNDIVVCLEIKPSFSSIIKYRKFPLPTKYYDLCPPKKT